MIPIQPTGESPFGIAMRTRITDKINYLIYRMHRPLGLWLVYCVLLLIPILFFWWLIGIFLLFYLLVHLLINVTFKKKGFPVLRWFGSLWVAFWGGKNPNPDEEMEWLIKKYGNTPGHYSLETKYLEFSDYIKFKEQKSRN